MRKMIIPAILFGLVSLSAQAAAPIHISLKATAAVSAGSDGFFSLGSVADVTGGTSTERDRLRDVPVGRAPLPNEVRRLTQGDIRLKLRQAGYRPNVMAVVDGADQSQVTVASGAQSAGAASAAPRQGSSPNAVSADPQTPAPPAVHRGDPVTIVVQDGDMTISARGVARDQGSVGDRIHVHREGVMTDLMAVVIDNQTVRMEM